MISATKIRAIMEQKGITQATLSRRTGLTASHISYILSRSKSGSDVISSTLYKLCDALECDPRDIRADG